MYLEEQTAGWALLGATTRVSKIEVDHRLTIQASDTMGLVSICIESPFIFTSSTGQLSLDPAKPSSLSPILYLFDTEILRIEISLAGLLRVLFQQRNILEVTADESYEAWQVGFHSGLFVCNPGGNVTIFRE